MRCQMECEFLGLPRAVISSFLSHGTSLVKVSDLLNPGPNPLAVRWNETRGFYVENLFVVTCEVFAAGLLFAMMTRDCLQGRVRGAKRWTGEGGGLGRAVRRGESRHQPLSWSPRALGAGGRRPSAGASGGCWQPSGARPRDQQVLVSVPLSHDHLHYTRGWVACACLCLICLRLSVRVSLPWPGVHVLQRWSM